MLNTFIDETFAVTSFGHIGYECEYMAARQLTEYDVAKPCLQMIFVHGLMRRICAFVYFAPRKKVLFVVNVKAHIHVGVEHATVHLQYELTLVFSTQLASISDAHSGKLAQCRSF